MAENVETRRRFVLFDRGGRGVPSTHDDEFRVAFKRQKRAAAASDELDAETTPELDLWTEKFDDPVRAKRLFGQRKADKIAMIADAEDHAEDDERLLESVEVEVVEIDTISGPRRVWADRVDEYRDVLA